MGEFVSRKRQKAAGKSRNGWQRCGCISDGAAPRCLLAGSVTAEAALLLWRSRITGYAASCCGVTASKDSDGSMRLSNWSSSCRSRPRRRGKQPRLGRCSSTGANRLPTIGLSMATSFSQLKSRPSDRLTESSPRLTSVTSRIAFKSTLARHPPQLLTARISPCTPQSEGPPPRDHLRRERWSWVQCYRGRHGPRHICCPGSPCIH